MQRPYAGTTQTPMAIQTKSIKRRIKSVKNTRKITKAMELVAASKMRKAVSSAVGTRPFAHLAWKTVRAVSRVTDTSLHPFLAPRAGNRTLVILITSDRGLAGGFNTNILKRTFVELKAAGDIADFVCVGKRGADAVRRAQRPMIGSFLNITNNPRFEEVLPIGKLAVDEFLKGNYDRVKIAYTDFVSAITQKPTVLPLLPLGKEDEGVEGRKEEPHSFVKATGDREYLFEPNPIAVLDKI